MTTIPALERALDEAAHRHYGRRRRRLLRPWRLAVPALATGLAALAVVIGLPEGRDPPVQEETPTVQAVPAATLRLSRALTLAPDIADFRAGDEDVVPHARLAAVAAEYERRTPYPPGAVDDFDWAATPAGPRDMGSFNYRRDIQQLVEFRASCIWQSYWLAAAAQPESRRAAAAVLADVPSWPGWRWPSNAARAKRLAGNAAAGDIAAVTANFRGDCRNMKTPWR